MKKLEILFGILRVPVDALAVALSLVLAYRLREARIDLVPGVQLLEPAQSLPIMGDYVGSFVVPAVAIFVIVAALLRLYAFRGTGSGWREVGAILVASGLWLVLVMGWYFFLRKELFFSRILLLHATLLVACIVSISRALLTIGYRSLLRSGYGIRTVVTVGSPLHALTLAAIESEIGYRYLGHARGMAQVRALADRAPVDLLLETSPHPESSDTLELIEYCRSRHIEYAFLPPVFAESPHLLRADRLGLLPMVRFQPTPLDGWGRVWKRAFDIVVSGLLLVLLSPLFLATALAILLFDGGRPVFYVSRRVGQMGRRVIPVLKFRSMVRDADQRKEDLQTMNHRRDGPLFKIKDDPRITGLGRFLRRWSIDELPQLLSVFVGHLSLVGPRPHLRDEVNLYADRERRVFAVKPGMTGLAQISGRSDLKFEDEVKFDLQYVEEWSILLDLWILWRTLFVVAGRKGAD